MRVLFKVIVDNLDIRNFPTISGTIVGKLHLSEEVIGDEIQENTSGSWVRIEGTSTWFQAENNKRVRFAEIIEILELDNRSKSTPQPVQKQEASQVSILERPLSVNTSGTARAVGGIDKEMLDMLKMSNIQDRIESIIRGSTRLFGIPHQFISSADPRNNPRLDIGRKYAENIIAEAPVVTIIPGKPNYMPDTSDTEKQALTQLFSSGDRGDSAKGLIDNILGDRDTRYFGFLSDYYRYTRYANLLCGVMAIMLGLEDNYGFKSGNDIIPYYKFDWAQYRFLDMKRYSKDKEGIFMNEEPSEQTLFSKFIDELSGKAANHIQFYVEPSTSFNESASNNTQQSAVEGLFQQAQGYAKEFAFLTSATGATAIDNTRRFTAEGFQNLADRMPSDSFLKRVLGMGSNVFTGANIVFPELWSDSSYQKGYTISMNLVSPYGTKEAIYLNLLVPLAHILALAIPRQVSANSYGSPCLVKAFSPGWFNCEMGVIDNITIDKASSGDAWTVDGLPTELKVSISIKDLYSSLMITPDTNVMKFFNNQSLMEHLATTCGIDLIKPELRLKVDLMQKLVFRSIEQLPTRLYQETITTIRENFTGYWENLTRFTKY